MCEPLNRGPPNYFHVIYNFHELLCFSGCFWSEGMHYGNWCPKGMTIVDQSLARLKESLFLFSAGQKSTPHQRLLKKIWEKSEGNTDMCCLNFSERWTALHSSCSAGCCPNTRAAWTTEETRKNTTTVDFYLNLIFQFNAIKHPKLQASAPKCDKKRLTQVKLLWLSKVAHTLRCDKHLNTCTSIITCYRELL